MGYAKGFPFNLLWAEASCYTSVQGGACHAWCQVLLDFQLAAKSSKSRTELAIARGICLRPWCDMAVCICITNVSRLLDTHVFFFTI